MTARSLAPLLVFLLGGAFAGIGACNSGLVADCPTAAITQGGACTEDNLECPYTLSSPASCRNLQTSCICTSGLWACPTPTDCSEGGVMEAGPEGGSDGGPDSPTETGPGDSTLGDSFLPDSLPFESSFEGGFESGPAETGPGDSSGDGKSTDGSSKDAAKSSG